MHSMAMCWFLIGIIFLGSVFIIDAERMTLNQLEKIVVDLKVSNEIQSQRISEIQFENIFFKETIQGLLAANEQLTERIDDVLDENRKQKKINNQLKMKISEIKTLLKSSDFKQLLKTKSNVLHTNKTKKNVETDGLLNDDNKKEKAIGTDSFEHRIKENVTAVNVSGRTSQKRLLLTDNPPIASSGVAFYAYLSRNEPNAGAHQTFVFDVDHTNIGGHYSHHTGVFTCPSHGVYVFSCSIYCNSGGYVFSELVVNSSPVAGKFVGSGSVTNILSSTDLAIVELNAGDEVYIRTPPNNAASGQVISNPEYRSTFSGWKLF